jgi:tetratricopeptide (TPR) repeat protein
LTEFGVGVSIATSATADGVAHDHHPSERHLPDVPIPGRRSPQAVHFPWNPYSPTRRAHGRITIRKGLTYGNAIPHERGRVAPIHAATADRNRAAEAFALSLECAAAGDIAGEEAALRTALDAVPDDPAANINYGNRMYNSGRFQEALSCYNTAVCADAANVLALFNRGNALEELGFFAEAIADWTSAVALEPDCADVHYNLARALSRDGRRREALRHWTKYLALDSARAWASRARRERKRLLKLEPLQIVSRKIA